MLKTFSEFILTLIFALLSATCRKSTCRKCILSAQCSAQLMIWQFYL